MHCDVLIHSLVFGNLNNYNNDNTNKVSFDRQVVFLEVYHRYQSPQVKQSIFGAQSNKSHRHTPRSTKIPLSPSLSLITYRGSSQQRRMTPSRISRLRKYKCWRCSLTAAARPRRPDLLSPQWPPNPRCVLFRWLFARSFHEKNTRKQKTQRHHTFCTIYCTQVKRDSR